MGRRPDTVKLQYTRGPFRIAAWAHIVNAHIFPGPAVIAALQEAADETATALQRSVSTEITIGTPHASEGEEEDSDSDDEDGAATEDAARRAHAALAGRKGSVVATTTIRQTVQVARQVSGHDLAATGASTPHEAPPQAEDLASALGDPPPVRGLLLLAQMSSKGHMMNASYTRACVAAARACPGFVLGFVAQEGLNETTTDNFVTMTPGVSLPREGQEVTGDRLGQQYRTPETVIGTEGCDIIIVGRAILDAKDRAREAARYRAEAWRAYARKLSGAA